MIWLKDNLASIITLLMIIGLLYLCAKSLLNSKKSGIPSCGCGKNCSTCALACAHGHLPKK